MHDDQIELIPGIQSWVNIKKSVNLRQLNKYPHVKE